MADPRRHMDCRNFAPLDVVKGLCHRTKDTVAADGDACEHFVALPKCRHCSSYAAGEQPHLGSCRVTSPPVFAYPEMVAVTCEHFAWR
mgnify:CR=1 FL=1